LAIWVIYFFASSLVEYFPTYTLYKISPLVLYSFINALYPLDIAVSFNFSAISFFEKAPI